jgi:peptide/nickel transport system substrate-binding protein
VWFGLENGLATAETAPDELAPLFQQQLCWPKWGKYAETRGRGGEAPALPEAIELAKLRQDWLHARDLETRQAIWQRMLAIRTDAVFSIGTVRGVPQPVVVSRRLRNVPREGVYNWEPGAFFGVYHPDTFWFADGVTASNP